VCSSIPKDPDEAEGMVMNADESRGLVSRGNGEQWSGLEYNCWGLLSSHDSCTKAV
jgi:hypothetical protein